jgi:hypothetical protein
MAARGYKLLHEQGLLGLYQAPPAGAPRITEHIDRPPPS